jgi:hypothetical protein
MSKKKKTIEITTITRNDIERRTERFPDGRVVETFRDETEIETAETIESEPVKEVTQKDLNAVFALGYETGVKAEKIMRSWWPNAANPQRHAAKGPRFDAFLDSRVRPHCGGTYNNAKVPDWANMSTSDILKELHTIAKKLSDAIPPSGPRPWGVTDAEWFKLRDYAYREPQPRTMRAYDPSKLQFSAQGADFIVVDDPLHDKAQRYVGETDAELRARLKSYSHPMGGFLGVDSASPVNRARGQVVDCIVSGLHPYKHQPMQLPMHVNGEIVGFVETR